MRVVAFVIGVVLAGMGLAHADDELRRVQLVKGQELMKAAEQAEQAARDAGDLAAYDACGEAYLAARAQWQVIGEDDLVALALVIELERTAPKHALVPRARLRAATWRQRLGDHAGAAADLVFFGTRYAGEYESGDSLWDAIALYETLGDRPAMERTANLWIKRFAARNVTRAVELALHLATPRGDAKKRRAEIRALEAWMKRYGRTRETAARCLARANEAGVVDHARECLAIVERFEGRAPERLPRPAWGVPTPPRP